MHEHRISMGGPQIHGKKVIKSKIIMKMGTQGPQNFRVWVWIKFLWSSPANPIPIPEIRFHPQISIIRIQILRTLYHYHLTEYGSKEISLLFNFFIDVRIKNTR
jgi:hypothetical protein